MTSLLFINLLILSKCCIVSAGSVNINISVDDPKMLAFVFTTGFVVASSAIAIGIYFPGLLGAKYFLGPYLSNSDEKVKQYVNLIGDQLESSLTKTVITSTDKIDATLRSTGADLTNVIGKTVQSLNPANAVVNLNQTMFRVLHNKLQQPNYEHCFPAATQEQLEKLANTKNALQALFERVDRTDANFDKLLKELSNPEMSDLIQGFELVVSTSSPVQSQTGALQSVCENILFSDGFCKVFCNTSFSFIYFLIFTGFILIVYLSFKFFNNKQKSV